MNSTTSVLTNTVGRNSQVNPTVVKAIIGGICKQRMERLELFVRSVGHLTTDAIIASHMCATIILRRMSPHHGREDAGRQTHRKHDMSVMIDDVYDFKKFPSSHLGFVSLNLNLCGLIPEPWLGFL
jgi:hypothetical protein